MRGKRVSEIKVINFLSFPILERAGGPSTYLYNLKEGLNETQNYNCNMEVIFLSTNINNQNSFRRFLYKELKRIVKLMLKKISYRLLIRLSISRMLTNSRRQILGLLNQIEADTFSNIVFIHFHSPFDIYVFYNIMKSNLKFPKKILSAYTYHLPESLYSDFIKSTINIEEVSTDMHDKLYREISILNEIEIEALKMADILILPCEEVLDIYKSTYFNPSIFKIVQTKKIIYIPTGTVGFKEVKDGKYLRERYSIPENAFVVSFVGRHDKIKGYDILKEAARYVWKENENIYFIVGGKQSPIVGIKNERRWIEVGWTNDVGSLMNASNVFVLPNRSTFFDLAILEAMSLGKPIITSRTGGNLYLRKLSNGIIFPEELSPKGLAKTILHIAKENPSVLYELGRLNRIAYEKYFTHIKFASTYLEKIEEYIENLSVKDKKLDL